MLKLRPKPKLGDNQIPVQLTTLSVSWLNNEFKAAAIHRGSIVASWERPGDTDGAGDFGLFIREAVEQTGYQGQTVSLVLAHPRLVQQLVDVPPVSGPLLEKVIQRQAQQQQMFPGETAWTYQNSLIGKGKQTIVLHLLPRPLLNQLIQGCKLNGLHLAAVLPASAVLQLQLPQLPLDKTEFGLLAAETGGSTTLLIGRNDGQIILARTLSDSWTESPDRFAVNLKRTILFASQQYAVTLSKGVWLFGPGADQASANVQRQIELPVNASPVPSDHFYWATAAARLAHDSGPNFLSAKQQKAPQRRAFAEVVAALTILAVIASLAASGYFLYAARQEAANIKRLRTELARLDGQRVQLEQLDSEMGRKKQAAKLVLGDRQPPIPAWLLAYLGQIVPDDLVVTNVQIARRDDLWSLKLAGVPQQGLKHPVAQPVGDALALLRSRLAGSPFHLKIIEPGEKAREAQPKAEPASIGATGPGPGWINRLTSAVTGKPLPPKAAPIDHFYIEGLLR
jgi:hypothetical protein